MVYFEIKMKFSHWNGSFWESQIKPSLTPLILNPIFYFLWWIQGAKSGTFWSKGEIW